MNDVLSVVHIIKGVEWTTELRLVCILFVLYFLCILCSFLTWESVNLQAAYFSLLCIGIYAAEYINKWCALNWKLISAKHQYFDSSGMFISIFYSLPLLINMLVLVIKWMKTASVALIFVKRQELRRQNQENNKKRD